MQLERVLLAFLMMAGATIAQATILIDNDLTPGDLGYFSVEVNSGGETVEANLTVQPAVTSPIPVTKNLVAGYFTLMEIGGQTLRLNLSSFATSGPVLAGDDLVTSAGSITGQGGNTINWTAESTIPDGSVALKTVYTFTAATGTLGDLKLFQFLDESIDAPGNCVFQSSGSESTGDLELFTFDGLDLFGIGQTGAFSASQGLANASFSGWAAGINPGLGFDLLIGNPTYSLAGDTGTLASFVHPDLGTVFGPADIASFMVWTVDATATTATITTVLGSEADGGNQLPTAAAQAFPVVANAADQMPGPFDDINVECDQPEGRLITLDGTPSTDPDGDTLTYAWSVSDLSVVLGDATAATTIGLFPIGVTMATLTVDDGRGGISTADVTVTVQDTNPPNVQCFTNLARLWPPNHRMRAVCVVVQAYDPCMPIVPVTVSVTSSEPDNAPGWGDGHTTGDVNGQDGFTAPVNIPVTFNPCIGPNGAWVATVYLRAERNRCGSGRKYTIEATAVDASGNVNSSSCCVVVPRSLRGRHHWH
ncbi:MAG: hypothetical protein KDB53_10625 [Planctomycetes bacterium]|nr:hypothetical protein [Planctomycetota bacterium]